MQKSTQIYALKGASNFELANFSVDKAASKDNGKVHCQAKVTQYKQKLATQNQC